MSQFLTGWFCDQNLQVHTNRELPSARDTDSGNFWLEWHDTETAEEGKIHCMDSTHHCLIYHGGPQNCEGDLVLVVGGRQGICSKSKPLQSLKNFFLKQFRRPHI